MKYTMEQIEKAKKKEELIKKVESGEDLRKCCKEMRIIKPITYPKVKRDYNKYGFESLIDKRQGTSYKLTPEIKKYILEEKSKNKSKSGRNLSSEIRELYGVKVSQIHINRYIRSVNLNDPVGRKVKSDQTMIDGPKPIHASNVGLFFLKGAVIMMKAVEMINQTIGDSISETREKNKLAGMTADFKFLEAKPENLTKYNEILLYLPAIGIKKLPELDKHHKRDLGLLIGKTYHLSYSLVDKYLSELEKLRISERLTHILAKKYLDIWYLSVELEDLSTFYIDGHFKQVYSDTNIPKGFHGTKKQVTKGIEEIFVHGYRGHPLIFKSCPGDTHLTKHIFDLISALDGTAGKEIALITVFDREGDSIEIFKEFKRREKHFITLLRSDQYRANKKTIQINRRYKDYCRNKRNNKTYEIADAKITLKDENKNDHTFRVGLLRVKKLKNAAENEKVIPIITNLQEDEISDIKTIADKYLARWPIQEDSFKEMIPNVNLDVNYGYKKLKVPNRTLEKRKSELNDDLRIANEKIESYKKHIEKIEVQIKKLETQINSKMEEFYAKKHKINDQISKSSQKDTSKLLKQLTKIEKTINDLHQKYNRKLTRYLTKKQPLDNKLKAQSKRLDKTKRKIQSLRLGEKLFEIDTEKDHIMTNFEVILNNAIEYAKEHFFGLKYEDARIRTLNKIFFHRDGSVIHRDDRIEVILDNCGKKEILNDLKKACRVFNKNEIKNYDGRRIFIRVNEIVQ